MVTDVYVKCNYDRLRIDKVLWIFENLITTTRRTRTTFVSLGNSVNRQEERSKHKCANGLTLTTESNESVLCCCVFRYTIGW